jgi:hypothetical protein
LAAALARHGVVLDGASGLDGSDAWRLSGAAGLGPTARLFAGAGLSSDLLLAATGLAGGSSALGPGGGGHEPSGAALGAGHGSTGHGSTGHGSTGGGSGSGGSSGGGESRAAALLAALGACEAAFLAKSLGAVRMPVDQMFPSVEGYANAIPSKHDLAAFMRVVQVRGLPFWGPRRGPPRLLCVRWKSQQSAAGLV